MSDIDTAAADLSRAIQGVARKIASATDPQEKQALEQTLSDLQDRKAALATGDLAAAAAAVRGAAASLQAVTGTARTDPADVLIGTALDSLRTVEERLSHA